MTKERERKELNKKVLKTTFSSEMKSKKKFDGKRFILDFIMLFIGISIADMICQWQGIEMGFLYGVICLCMMVIMLGASAGLNSKFFRKHDK